MSEESRYSSERAAFIESELDSCSKPTQGAYSSARWWNQVSFTMKFGLHLFLILLYTSLCLGIIYQHIQGPIHPNNGEFRSHRLHSLKLTRKKLFRIQSSIGNLL